MATSNSDSSISAATKLACLQAGAQRPDRAGRAQEIELALRGIRGDSGTSRRQGGDEGAEQGLAAAAVVVHEREEGEVERQLLVRDAPVRAEPGAQQRPGPLHGVDVHLADAVAVLVARILPAPVAGLAG